jgi:hypothetical protein
VRELDELERLPDVPENIKARDEKQLAAARQHLNVVRHRQSDPFDVEPDVCQQRSTVRLVEYVVVQASIRRVLLRPKAKVLEAAGARIALQIM